MTEESIKQFDQLTAAQDRVNRWKPIGNWPSHREATEKAQDMGRDVPMTVWEPVLMGNHFSIRRIR